MFCDITSCVTMYVKDFIGTKKIWALHSGITEQQGSLLMHLSQHTQNWSWIKLPEHFQDFAGFLAWTCCNTNLLLKDAWWNTCVPNCSNVLRRSRTYLLSVKSSLSSACINIGQRGPNSRKWHKIRRFLVKMASNPCLHGVWASSVFLHLMIVEISPTDS